MLKYILVFCLTLLIFLFGVLLGNYFTEQKFSQITNIEDDLRLQTAGAELQYLLLLQEPCKYINSTPLTDDLYQISERLDYMETQRGENDPDVLRLKNSYSLLQLRHWLFSLKTNEQCATNQVPILYFYSNQGDCPDCKEQGYTLTYLRRAYPGLLVYSFDVNLENPALDTLKRVHGIDATPMLVLPDQTRGFSTIDELRPILDDYGLEATE
jgi:hypothetical protein